MKGHASGAIFDDQDRILCVKRAYGDFSWTLPGGGIEINEDPLHAVVREAYEETRYRVEVVHLIGVYCAPWMDDYVFLFQLKVLDHDEWQPDKEISQIGYFHKDALPQPMKIRTATRIIDACNKVQGIYRTVSP